MHKVLEAVSSQNKKPVLTLRVYTLNIKQHDRRTQKTEGAKKVVRVPGSVVITTHQQPNN